VRYDIVSATASPATSPETTPFRIANGDWTVSPDGRRIAYVSADDYAIWVIELASLPPPAAD
jgi:hypothetical protein